jgi:hypothetical protein
MERLLGVYWDQPQPMLHMSDGSNETALTLETGTSLTVELGGDRHCIGTYSALEGKRVLCPTDALLEAGPISHCPHCQGGEAFTAKTGLSSMGGGSGLLDEEHTVYLALFGVSEFKVGVAQTIRREARLREQGSVASMFIGTADGRAARQLEQRIHDKTGITMQMRTAKKLELLTSAPAKEPARARLKEAMDNVRQRLANAQELTEEFSYWQDGYGIDTDSLPSSIELVTRVERHARVTGVVVGVLGRSVLLQTRETLYALGSNLLEGFDASVATSKDTLGDAVTPHGIQSQPVAIDMQGSLF